MAYSNTQLFIAGKWRPSHSGKVIEVVNPATEEVIGVVAHAGQSDLDEALAAAAAGFKIWRNVAPFERCRIMRKAAAIMRERNDEIAPLLTMEQGKTLPEARMEAMAAADVIEWFAKEAKRAYGRLIPARGPGIYQLAMKEPVGPVAAFTPWNFPINQVVRKLSAALAAGCSIIVKAPEETPAAPAQLIRDLRISDPAPGDQEDLFHRFDQHRQAAQRARRSPHEARHHGTRWPRAGDRVQGR